MIQPSNQNNNIAYTLYLWLIYCLLYKRLEPMNSHEMTVVTDYTNYRELSVFVYGEILYYNTNYAFDG